MHQGWTNIVDDRQYTHILYYRLGEKNDFFAKCKDILASTKINNKKNEIYEIRKMK